MIVFGYLLKPMTDSVIEDLEPVNRSAAEGIGAGAHGANLIVTYH